MAKVRVSELAKKMGIAQQDLVFKLRSIGVRLEGEDETIDTEIIAAILTGKKLHASAARGHPARRRVDRQGSGGGAPAAAPPHPGQSTAPAAPPHHHPEGRAAHPRHPRPRAPAAAEVAAAGAALRADVAVEAAAPASTCRSTSRTRRRPRRSRSRRRRRPAPEVAARDGLALWSATRPPASRAPAPAPPPREKIIEEDEGAASARRRRRKERRTTARPPPPIPSGPVMVSEGMTVREFAEKLGVLAKDLIQRLMKRGVMAVHQPRARRQDRDRARHRARRRDHAGELRGGGPAPEGDRRSRTAAPTSSSARRS